jgi:hypothetical protein
MKTVKILLIVIISTTFSKANAQYFDAKSYIKNEAKRLNFEKEVYNADGQFELPLLYNAGKRSIDNYFRMVSNRVALAELRKIVRKGITLKDYYNLRKKMFKDYKDEDMEYFIKYPQNYLLIVPESGELKDVFVIRDNTPSERKKYKKSEIANFKEIEKTLSVIE